MRILGDGTIEWGAGGGAAPDTNLYRSSANTLKTDDGLTVAGSLVALGALVPEVNTAAPASPTAGQIYFDNTALDNTMKYYNGTAWVAAPNDTSYYGLQHRGSVIPAAFGAALGCLSASGTAAPTMKVATANAVSSFGIFYFDPADHLVGGQTTQLRIRASMLTNATAPTVNFTSAMHPVTANAGGANTHQLTTIGAAVGGSSAAINAPGASNRFTAVSTAFTPPAAGYYCLGVTTSGAPAATSFEDLFVDLQVSHITI